MKLSRIAIPAALALIAWMPSSAALEKGNKELNATFSYDNIEDDDNNELTTTIIRMPSTLAPRCSSVQRRNVA